MKKLINFFKSPKSDIVLFFILIVLVNLVSGRAFGRLDLTEPKSYSLSKGSKQVVKTLEEPLTVKVFFSDNLNAPYSSVYQYIKDIFVEYKGNANSNFSCEYVDMKKPENEKLARSYGLNQIQIQELKNNEVGLKQVWMGLVLLYADRIEILDALTSTDGLEYRITTTISKMVSTTSALAGLKGKAKLTLYATNALSEFKISGFNQMEGSIREAYSAVNKKNMNRIEFQRLDPPAEELPALIEKYGLQGINWNDPKLGQGSGVIGLVLEYGEKFNLIPLKMGRDFFGRNLITGLDGLEENLEVSLQALVSKSQEIGYITDHGEMDFNDAENGSGRFAKLISDRYTFKEIKLAEEDIPSSLTSIVIDGPKASFTEEELYKIDQFVLKGGNLIVFADPFDEQLPQGQAAYYQQPTYTPLNTGIEKNLEKFGIKLNKNYVYDENCYVQNDRRYGKLNFYFAPMMQKNSLDSKSPVTKNLGYVIFMQNGAIDVDLAKENKNAKLTVLAKSSPNSWTVENNISTNPTFISVPGDKSTMKSENLAVLVEGKFESAFGEKAPEFNSAQSEKNENSLASNTHLAKSVQNGKVIVVSSSKVTGPQLIDETGNQPVAMFMRNIIDYMNGEEDLCSMRTKGLSLNTLTVKNQKASTVAKYFNEIGLAVLVALAGLLVLLKIKAKKRAIRAKYNPNDSRIVEK
ncbi:MAG: Gldg family protein [Treponema sp.]|nr:Gldg family protein [Candidatus Treponema equifaecale]